MPKTSYIVIAAVTIDGKIALSSKHNSSWTSKEDKDFLHAMLDKCDVVVVGNNTYKAAKKPLSKRNCIVFTSKVTSNVKKNSRLLYCNPERTDIKKLIEKLGYKKIALLGGAQTYTFFLQKNLVNDIYLTIEPLTFGMGLNLFGSSKPLVRNFKLVSIKKLNKAGTLLLHYKS